MRDRREKGWFWLENEIVDRIDLEPLERLLYMVLARHSNEETSESFPGEETLCLKSGIKDKRTIRKYIKSLEIKNLIEVKREKGKSNRYYLKNVKLVTKDDITSNESSNILCNKLVTFDVETSSMGCYSNKINNKTNNNMNHEEYNFFEKLFERIGVNFTITNQNSIYKLLENMNKEEVEKYLLETYENLKHNPNIKNLSGAFSKKIQKGERQLKYNEKIRREEVKELKNQELENQKIINIQKDQILTLDLVAAEKEEKAKLDEVFNNLSKQEQEMIMKKAFSIAIVESNGFEPFAKLMANSKIKYNLLKDYYI